MKALTYDLALQLFRDHVACTLTRKLSLEVAITKARDNLSPFLKLHHLDKAEGDVRANPPRPLGA